jgi:hypothetical protein
VHRAQDLGGISPIDGPFVREMGEQGLLGMADAAALHGSPLDPNHWETY